MSSKYTITITEKGFTIYDQCTSCMVTSMQGKVVLQTLPFEEVLEFISSVQNKLLSDIKLKLRHRPCPTDAMFTLKSDNVGGFKLTLNAEWVKTGKYSLEGTPGFNVKDALFQLSTVYSVLYTAYTQASRKVIVKMLPDMELLTAVTDKGTLVCSTADVHGNILTDVLLNGNYYRQVIINVHNADNLVYIYDGNLDTIATMPIDMSVQRYFSDESKWEV